MADGDSMSQLMAARERRNAHEIEAHDYHHVLLVEPTTDALRSLTALRIQRATRR